MASLTGQSLLLAVLVAVSSAACSRAAQEALAPGSPAPEFSLPDVDRGKGIAFVAINPNNPQTVRLDELGYTDVSDSLEEIKLRANARGISWPYLYDGETQATEMKFGAVATPPIFIFDADRKLRYPGRIDDNQREELVKVHAFSQYAFDPM